MLTEQDKYDWELALKQKVTEIATILEANLERCCRSVADKFDLDEEELEEFMESVRKII